MTAGLNISTVDDGVLVVEMDRPPGNLWTTEDCRRLTALLLDPPQDAHVVVIRSRGEVFCLGRERGGATPGELHDEVSALVGLVRALRSTSLVTVAEVQGDAAGFGVVVAGSCAVTLAVEGAGLSFPEVEIGLAPALVLAWLPRVVGEREAFWLTATGRSVSATRALQLGLVNAVAPTRDALRTDVDACVAELRRRSPRVHADIRSMLTAMGGVEADAALGMSVSRLVVGSLRRQED